MINSAALPRPDRAAARDALLGRVLAGLALVLVLASLPYAVWRWNSRQPSAATLRLYPGAQTLSAGSVATGDATVTRYAVTLLTPDSLGSVLNYYTENLSHDGWLPTTIDPVTGANAVAPDTLTFAWWHGGLAYALRIAAVAASPGTRITETLTSAPDQ